MRARTPEEAKEYMQKRTYNRILDEYIIRQTECVFCHHLVQTLHHIDENHAHNSRKNLLPICLDCHMNIKHRIADNPDIPIIFQSNHPQKGGFRAFNCPKKRVLKQTLRYSTSFGLTPTLSAETPFNLTNYPDVVEPGPTDWHRWVYGGYPNPIKSDCRR